MPVFRMKMKTVMVYEYTIKIRNWNASDMISNEPLTKIKGKIFATYLFYISFFFILTKSDLFYKTYRGVY